MKRIYLVLIIILMIFTIGCSKSGDVSELYLFQDKDTNLYGYMDYKGKIAINAMFLEAEDFTDDGFANVIDENGTFKIVDKDGQELLKSEKYRVIDSKLNDSLYVVGESEKVIEVSSGIIFFDDIEEEDKNIRKIGVVNKENEFILEYGEYEDIYLVNDNKSIYVLESEEYSKGKLLDLEGNIIFSSDSDEIISIKNISGRVKETVLKVKNNDGKTALVDSNGKFITDFIYDEIGFDYSDETINEKKKTLYLELKEKLEINEIVPALKEGKWGYINIFNGQEVIPFKFEYAEEFIKDMAVVSIDNEYRTIDNEGQYLENSVLNYSSEEVGLDIYPIYGSNTEVTVNFSVDRLNQKYSHVEMSYEYDGEKYNIEIDEEGSFILSNENGNIIYDDLVNRINFKKGSMVVIYEYIDKVIDHNGTLLAQSTRQDYKLLDLKGNTIFDDSNFRTLPNESIILSLKIMSSNNANRVYDSSGELLLDGEYEVVESYEDLDRIVTKDINAKWAVFNQKGREVFDLLDNNITSIKVYKNNLYKVEYVDGRFIWVNDNGKEIKPI